MTARYQDRASSGKKMIRGEIVVLLEDVQRDVVPQAERGERVIGVEKVESVSRLVLEKLFLACLTGREIGGARGVRWWWRRWRRQQW